VDLDYYETYVSGKLVCLSCAGCPYNLFTSATLKDEWTKIELLFTQPPIIPIGSTNNSPLLCDTIFDGTLNSLLGIGYSCEINGNILIVNLGQNAQFRPDSKLTVKFEKLYITTCDCPWRNQISISIIEPVTISMITNVNPTTPLGICGSATITLSSMTGIGNRPFYTSYSYSVDSVKSSDSSFPREEALYEGRILLNKYLQDKTSTNVQIPGSLLIESAIYTIKANFKTYLDEYDGYVALETAYPKNPKIELLGASDKSLNSMTESQKLSAYPQLFNGECYLQSANRYNFNWSEIISSRTNKMNETMLNNSYSRMSGYLEIQPFSLVPDSYYELFLNVTHKDFPIYANTSLMINVLGNKLLAIISGGDMSVDVQDELILDGSYSQDSIFLT